MSRVRSFVGAALLIGGVSASAAGQAVSPLGVMPEVRADVRFGHASAVQVGAGVQIPAGFYVRVGLDGAVGRRVNDVAGFGSRLDARLDLLARFLLDPFRQSRYGFSVGGGMGLLADPGDHVRPVLLAAMELEGERWSSGWVPALQAGLGGGGRVGIVLRRGAPRAR